ncbi:hypothetical protein Q9189_008143 [Teloschistes chrysophthalmus]
MPSSHILPLTLSALLYLTPTVLAIDIHITWYHKHPSPLDPIIATCLAIAEWDCCRPDEAAILPSTRDSLHDYKNTTMRFAGLRYPQSGSAWHASGGKFHFIECAGVPIVQTRPGEGDVLFTPPKGEEPLQKNMAFSAAWGVAAAEVREGAGMRAGRGPSGARPQGRRVRYPDYYRVGGKMYWVAREGGRRKVPDVFNGSAVAAS